MDDIQGLLEKASFIRDDFKRRLAAASIVTKAFSESGLFVPVIVGGTAVSLYTQGKYGTVDIDMKSEQVDEYKTIMEQLGFARVGKDFYHDKLQVYIEFPSGRMEDSEEHFREIIVDETNLPIYVVGYEDIILDRAMKFDATKDQDAREWALRMIGVLYDDIDWSYLHRRAKELYILDVVERMQRDVKRYKGVYRAVRNRSSE